MEECLLGMDLPSNESLSTALHLVRKNSSTNCCLLGELQKERSYGAGGTNLQRHILSWKLLAEQWPDILCIEFCTPKFGLITHRDSLQHYRKQLCIPGDTVHMELAGGSLNICLPQDPLPPVSGLAIRKSMLEGMEQTFLRCCSLSTKMKARNNIPDQCYRP